MTFEMKLDMAEEKVDAVVKRQCHARGLSLVKHHDKAKTNKGVLNRAKVRRLRAVPIFFLSFVENGAKK